MRSRTIVFGLILLIVTTAAKAVDFGWESLPGGGIEYVFQVEPDLLDTFGKEGFSSVIPPGLRDVRKIRLVVGKDKLPNQGNIEGPAPAAAPARSPSAAIPLPLHPGAAKNIADSNLSETAATKPSEPVAADASAKNDTEPGSRYQAPDAQRTGWDYPSRPELKGNDPADRTFGANNSERQPFGAAKPYSSDAPPNDSQRQETTPARPWWALVIVLLALFASLGGNVYLVWIHQAVRSKYRALVSQTGAKAAAI